ncbi:MAG: 23S rRNA (adenine(2503)-C(2))-methyltransferase RlmN [Verrucomicrobia bacterium]|nr:23S rRNA (adenine(2503)-C(2))-methyltransferase RlmN [Verrucomicrobiota bacterium]
MQSLYSLTESELRDWLTAHGEKSYHAGQVFQWLYEKKVGAWEEMTNLSKTLREKLSQSFRLHSLKLRRILDSEDCQTTKFLWELPDGNLVESVLIRAPERRTVCVSSQVGCPARCAFCASGKNGLMRNLETAEIIEQVIQIDRYLKEKGEKVCHIVFMGMGEPFENYDNVLKTIRLINDPKGLNISQRKMTVSTVGIVDKIMRFADEGLSVNLVLSLHAPNQHLRKKIMPYARKYELSDLLDAMLYFAKTSRRDITYEYTLMEGLNDGQEQAQELVKLVKNHPCTVNLIPYNPIEGIQLKRPGKEAIEQFREILVEGGIPTTWRYTKGKDIAAACGQLALQKN